MAVKALVVVVWTISLRPETQQHCRGRFAIRGIKYEQPVEGPRCGSAHVSIVRQDVRGEQCERHDCG